MSTKTAAYNIVSRSFNILSFLWVLALFPLSAFRPFKYGTIQCILHLCCSKDLLCTCLFAAHYSRAIPLTILLKYRNKLHRWRGFIFKGFSKRKLLCPPITFLSKNTISNINFPPVCVCLVLRAPLCLETSSCDDHRCRSWHPARLLLVAAGEGSSLPAPRKSSARMGWWLGALHLRSKAAGAYLTPWHLWEVTGRWPQLLCNFGSFPAAFK